MNGRIIEIGADGRFVHADRGFLVVDSRHFEIGRVPLDEVDAVVGSAHGVTFTSELLCRLAESAKPLVLVNAKYRPVGLLLGLVGNHRQGARMAAQAHLKPAQRGRLWKAVVQSKLRAQARTIEAFGGSGLALRRLATAVEPGDLANLEAQGARLYWKLLFGKAFRRDPDSAGVNGLLNYGYAVLRAATAKSIVAAGLHPGLGIHHHNEFNGAPLSDDLMEPFRPLFDACIKGLCERGVTEVDIESKRSIASCLYRSVTTDAGTSPIGTAIERLAISFALHLEGERKGLEFPGEVSADALRKICELDVS